MVLPGPVGPMSRLGAAGRGQRQRVKTQRRRRTDWSRPIAIMSANMAEPPEETNGRGRPVTGMMPTVIPILTNACTLPITAKMKSVCCSGTKLPAISRLWNRPAPPASGWTRASQAARWRPVTLSLDCQSRHRKVERLTLQIRRIEYVLVDLHAAEAGRRGGAWRIGARWQCWRGGGGSPAQGFPFCRLLALARNPRPGLAS